MVIIYIYLELDTVEPTAATADIGSIADVPPIPELPPNALTASDDVVTVLDASEPIMSN